MALTKEDHYYNGIGHFGEGRFDQAIAEYERALELDPRFTDALHGLAQAYFAKNDFDQAIAAAGRILEIDLDDILAYSTISRAYQKKGMSKEAGEAGNKARLLGREQQPKEPKSGDQGS